MTFGSVPPIVAVNFDRAPGADSGFLVVFADAPPPGEVGDEDAGWLCLHCLIDEHPEVGAALDMARARGEVWLVGGVWVPLDDVPGDVEAPGS